MPVQLLIILKERAYKAELERLKKLGPLPEDIEEALDEGTIEYVGINIIKHRIALWINALSIYFLEWDGVKEADPEQLQPLFIMAGALVVCWFAMTLKSLPSRYGLLGVVITFTMFVTFTTVENVLPIRMIQSGNTRLAILAVMGSVLFYYTTMLYDFADLLNIGLEPLQKKYFGNPKVTVDAIQRLTELIAQREGIVLNDVP